MEARLKLDSSRDTDQAGGSSCWPASGEKSTNMDEPSMLLPSLAVVVEITGTLAASFIVCFVTPREHVGHASVACGLWQAEISGGKLP